MQRWEELWTSRAGSVRRRLPKDSADFDRHTERGAPLQETDECRTMLRENKRMFLRLGEPGVWTRSRVEVQMHLGILILTASAAWHVGQGRQANLNRLTAARLAA